MKNLGWMREPEEPDLILPPKRPPGRPRKDGLPPGSTNRQHAMDAARAAGTPWLAVSPKHLKAAAMWLLGYPIRRIARELGVSSRTIHAWKLTPEWKQAEEAAQAQVQATHIRRFHGLLSRALTTAEEVLDGRREGTKQDWLQLQLVQTMFSRLFSQELPGGGGIAGLADLAPSDPDAPMARTIPLEALAVERLPDALPAGETPPSTMAPPVSTQTTVSVDDLPPDVLDATPVDPVAELRSSPWDDEEEEPQEGGWRSWR